MSFSVDVFLLIFLTLLSSFAVTLQEMETDQQVFSIVGPHTGNSYGDIILIFRRDLMFHPDFSVTCSAATSFRSGRVFEQYPWLGNEATHAGRKALFDKMKMNAAQPDFEEVLTQLITKMCAKGKNVTLAAFMAWWREQNSHFVLEGHLPAVVSVAAIEKIIIPQDIFDSLTAYQRSALRTWMPDENIIRTSPLGTSIEPNDNKHPARKILMDKA